MSKFIRLTGTSGHEFYANTDHVRRFGKVENIAPNQASYIDLSNERSSFMVTETPDQILALIEGDESGLRERVAFLEKALDQAIKAGNLELRGEKVWGREPGGRWCVVSTRFDDPELAAYMTTKKEQQS